jgi:hypothetical protein
MSNSVIFGKHSTPPIPPNHPLSFNAKNSSSAAFKASSSAIKPVITKKPSEPLFNPKRPNITNPYDYEKMAFGNDINWKPRINDKYELTGYQYTSPYNSNFTKIVHPGYYAHIMGLYNNRRKRGGGSRRRTVHRKHKSHRKSKHVRHTRRKQTRRHRHRR